ncbi:hypothetical protein ACP7OL_000554 [Salmonella enterica subsp. enterica]
MNSPKTVTLKPEGPVEISTGSDGRAVVSSEQLVSTNIKEILSYGIENIIEIRSYNIEQRDGKIYHHVVFHSGGSIELSVDLDGKNFNASTKELATSFRGGNRILIKSVSAK